MFRYRPPHLQSPMSQPLIPGASPGAGSGSSPSALADEEVAQKLLDRWYGNVNSIEAQPLDEYGIFSGLEWDGSGGIGGIGGVGGVGGAAMDFGNVGNNGNAGINVRGADSSIWESLVNQIKGTGT